MGNAIGTVTANVVANTKGFKKGMTSSITDMRQWQRQAKKVFESTRTPIENVQFEIAKLNNLHKRGFIDAITHARGVKALNASLVKTSLVTKVAAGAMRTLATSALLFIGPLAAIGAVFKGFRVAEDIGRAMNSSLAIMGDVSDEMKALMKSTANEVAASTIHSTEEVSKAYFFLTSAGLDAAQSVAAMPVAAKFAQAGLFDLSTAVDLLTDAQMALGLSSKDAQKNMLGMKKVGDVLVKANTIANASVQQFSEALTNKAAAAARRFNKDIEEVTATLAVFASMGVKGADAGTRYDIVLRNLSIKAIENKEAFRQAGIEVFNQAGKMKNLSDIIGDIERKFKGMSDEQKVATLMALGFTAKTISSTAGLVGNSEAMREMEAELRNAGGTMDEVSGKQMTEFQKGWEAISASAAEFVDVKLTPVLDSIGKALHTLTKELKETNGVLGTTGQIVGNLLSPALMFFLELFAGDDKKKPAKLIDKEEIVTATKATKAQAAAMTDIAIASEKANNSAKELAESLQFKLATVGMTSTEAQLHRIELAFDDITNIDRTRLEDAKRLNTELAKQTMEIKRQQTAMQRGIALAASVRTPEEVYRDQIADMRRLLAVGAIDPATLQRGSLQAFRDLQSATTPGTIGGAAGSLRGSAAARQSFVGANEMLKKAEERNRILKRIERGIDNIEQPDVAEVPA